ncbi:MAG: deoxynucleoside kinase [bacterium]|nr:deoxynucleoside kinase [bacterium]
MSEFTHLVLAGNIGAGKTTVTRLLGERLGWRCYYERVDGNPFLRDFYGDMERWAFALQLFFITHRLEDHRLINERAESAIQDRSIHEDALIFARNLWEMGHMNEGEWATYIQLYRQVLALLRPPDLVVYLRRSIPSLQANIRLRGREFEATIPLDYLTRLNEYYEDWIISHPSERVLIVEADDLDFIVNPEDLTNLLRHIKDAFGQQELFGNGDTGTPPADSRFQLLQP